MSTNPITITSLASAIVSTPGTSTSVSSLSSSSLSNFSSSSLSSLTAVTDSSAHAPGRDEDGLIQLEDLGLDLNIDNDNTDLEELPLLLESPTSTTAALVSSLALSLPSSLPSLHLSASATASSNAPSFSVSHFSASSLYSGLSVQLPTSPTADSSPRPPKGSSSLSPDKIIAMNSPDTDLNQTIFSPKGDLFTKMKEGIQEAGHNPTDQALQGIAHRRNISQGRLKENIGAIAEFDRRVKENPDNREAILEEISSRLNITKQQLEDLMGWSI